MPAGYCFDTDTLSAVLRRQPDMALVRRLAVLPPDQQYTTAISYAELVYGALKRGSAALADRVRGLVLQSLTVVPFDAAAAESYAEVRARLDQAGTPLAEPDLRMAATTLSRGLVLVTGNTRHFGRVPELSIENWL